MSTTDTPVQVLHVDDEPGFAEVTAEFLEQEEDHLTVETTTDPHEAIDEVSENPIDCIVSDYDMPTMDGLEFLESIREEYSELPFILFTGKGTEEVASRAISLGVDDYLQKGTGTEQYELLCNRIENLVDRYRTAHQLEKTRRQFRQIFERSHDAILILDPKRGEIRKANNRACELLGYEREELLALGPEDIHPHEVERFRQFVETVYEDSTGWTEELSCMTKEGVTVPVHVSASTIDIDDRPHLLALVRETTDEVDSRAQDEELVRTMVDHATDGLYVVDPQTGDIRDANATACQRLGYTRDELRDRSLTDIIPTGAIEPWEESVEELIEHDWIAQDMLYQRRDGSTYPVAIQAKHVVVKEEGTNLIVVAHDLTR